MSPLLRVPVFLRALLPLLFTLMWMPAAVHAQPQIPDTDTLVVPLFEEVTVTATRWEARRFDVPRTVSIVSAADLRDGLVPTLPDALHGVPGVLVQKTNLGGGSPFIRGLTGKQVLLLIDGIRMNNATFRFGPNQYLNTVDSYAAGRIEVVHGPGSVLYGSDALGGVVDIRTRVTPGNADSGLGARLFQRLSSADRGATSRLDVEGQAGAFSFSLGGTYRHFGDLRAGRGESPVGAVDVDGVQPHTGYDEGDLNAAVRYRLGEHQALKAVYLFARQEDVPRSNQLIVNDYFDTPDLVSVYDPQQLHFGYLAYEANDLRGPLAALRATASANVQTEGRRRQRDLRGDTQEDQDEVTVLGFGVQADFRPALTHTVTAGIELYHDHIASRSRVLSDAGPPVSGRGRFPDGTTYTTTGLYLQDVWSVAPALDLNLGLRYSLFRIEADFEGLTVGPVGPLNTISEAYSDLTWSAAGVWHAAPAVNVFAGVARGFRAPNVDDLAVDGAWDSGRDVPNPGVAPEQVVQYEAGVKVDRGGLGFGLSVYTNRYTDLIQRAYLDPGLDGEEGTPDDLFQFDNVAEAVIRGGELSGRWLLPQEVVGGYLTAFGHASYPWGEDTGDHQPLRRIPPPMGRLGLRWDAGPAGAWAAVMVRGALKQDRLSSGDVRDERIPAGGTPGWGSLDLRAGYTASGRLGVNLGVENLTDKRYRIHGSGIDEPGRNFILGVTALLGGG